MNINHLDHLVLTVAEIDKTIFFYVQVLGMQAITFAEGRQALKFGHQKINLHPADKPFPPKAHTPCPGSADLCFLMETEMSDIIAELQQHDIEIEQGPIQRTGATGPILSVYIRDPDLNLIELGVAISS